MVSAAYVILAYSLAVVSATPIPQAAEAGASTSSTSSEVVAPIDQVGETLTPISEAAGQLAASVPGESGRGSVRAASEGGNRSGGLYDPAVLVLMPYVMPPAAGGEGGSKSTSEGGAKGGSSSSSKGEGAGQGSSSTSGEGKGTTTEGGKSTKGTSSSAKGEGKAASEQGSTSGSSSEGGSKERTSTENTSSGSGVLGTASATGLAASASFKTGVSLVAAALTFIMAF
ncbi:hypothetical protein HDU81_009419 [Chytriomyces hyalinus]|nr:hypothetical protein HDU81_009419 [Chytriomyces hyalinus]